ncbi:MAG TPA: ABC transporter permease [Thermoanaerobaculia bacterium]|nr:ABC transporter permease [Thermoanaerobaculia bacterium]
MMAIIRDLTFAVRRLRKQPLFALIAISILALGIGANAAIFSVLDAVVLSPLPYPDPERLVQVWATAPELGLPQTQVSFPKFQALAGERRVFEAVTAFRNEYFNLTGLERPLQLQGARVSHTFFDVWGIEPVLGRRFLPAEDRKGGADVVLLSHGLWQRQYGGDPRILGQSLSLSGRSFTVIGVMPPVLRFPFRETQLWAPRVEELDFLSPETIEQGAGFLSVMARLKPGVSAESAQEEADRISGLYRDGSPNRLDAPFGLYLVSMNEQLVGQLRSSLFLLFGAVGCVLLIACADIGNLLLAQAVVRRREVAIRVAVGASRGQVLRQLFTEGLVLCLLGSAVGLLLATWMLETLPTLSAGNLPRFDEVAVDGRVLGFTLLLALFTSLFCSVAPARQILRVDAGELLPGSTRGASASRQQGRAQGLFVVAEVAMALVLLIGAGLLIQSFGRLRSVDLGFDPDDLLVIRVSLSDKSYPELAQKKVAFEQILDRVRTLPGVEDATASDYLPVRGAPRTPIAVLGRSLPPVEERPMAFRMMVSPGYFETLGTRLLQGRDFDPATPAEAPLVAVINETLVKQLFPGENPLGKYLLLGEQGETRMEIIGVVEDVQQQGLDVPNSPLFYLHTRQSQEAMAPASFNHLLVRTPLPPAQMARTVGDTVMAIDRDQPVAEFQTMEEIVSASIAGQRFTSRLLSWFSAVALVLCILGIYGVMAHAVSLREREIGVRMALGAQPRQVLATVMNHGLRLVLIGIGLGLATALFASRLMEGLLFEVSSHSPLQFLGVPLLLALVSLLACYLPARRVTRIHPAVTLRTD